MLRSAKNTISVKKENIRIFISGVQQALPEAGDDFAARAARFGQSFQAGCQAVQIVRQRPETFAALTEREWAVVKYG